MDITPRSALLAAGAVLGLLAAGCGTGPAPDAGPPAPTETRHAELPPRAAEPRLPVGQRAAARELDEEALALALLDLSDLPPGWAADSEEAAEERGIGVPEPAGRRCRAVFDQRADTRAEDRFARTEVGPFVLTRAGSYRSAERAERALEGFREAAAECTGFEAAEGPEDAPTPVDYTAEELDLPALGDDSVALRFVREGPGDDEMTVRVDVALVRVGAATVHLMQAGVVDEETGEIEPLIRRAVDKMAEVAADGTPEPTGSFPDVTELGADPYARSYE